MSSEHPNPTASALDALVGSQIPGGCQDCDAYQVLQRDAASGIYILQVYHDDTCPWLARRQGDRHS